METLGLQTLIQVLRDFGPFGCVLVLWWYDMKTVRNIQEENRKDVAKLSRMYENNAHLVEKNEQLSQDLKDVILLNTQAFQRLVDDVNGNQFCPMVRLEKQAQGVQR